MGRTSSNGGASASEYLPAIAMVVVQLGFAGMNVLSKLVLDSGMSPYVLTAYRNLIAAAFLAPIAFFLERNSRMAITKRVLFLVFLCSISGATLNQLLFYMGLKYTTPTVACALTNTLPAITFILAAALKMETVGIATRRGQAKVVGTLICVGGSMVMPFCKGPLVSVWPSPIHWRYVETVAAAADSTTTGGHTAILGDALIFISCIAWATWFIIQSKMSRSFSLPYTSSALMSLMAGIQCAVTGAAVEQRISVWMLNFDIRLISVLYIGILGSGMTCALMSWCIQERGPLYVSMFSPLLLILVAILGWGILEEKIYLGSAIGSIFIVGGLYMVLWGKGKDDQVGADLDAAEMEGSDSTRKDQTVKEFGLPVFVIPKD